MKDTENTAFCVHHYIEKGKVESEEEKKTRKKIGEINRRELERKNNENEIDWAMRIKERLNEQRRKNKEHETELEIKKFKETKLEEKKIDADVEKTKAQMESEKEKHKLEIYKKAEDSERDHQVRMMEKSAELMQASKQDVPDAHVQGFNRNSTSVKVESSSQKNNECPNCGTSVEEDWQVCPKCEEEL